ncbi:MAG: helix-turn-helix transcriptional regulator [Thermoproteota archaeon]
MPATHAMTEIKNMKSEIKISFPTMPNAEQVVTILKKDELKVYELIERQGFISQSEISKELGFSKTKVSNIVDLLEAYGLIERKRKGREKMLTVSKKIINNRNQKLSSEQKTNEKEQNSH